MIAKSKMTCGNTSLSKDGVELYIEKNVFILGQGYVLPNIRWGVCGPSNAITLLMIEKQRRKSSQKNPHSLKVGLRGCNVGRTPLHLKEKEGGGNKRHATGRSVKQQQVVMHSGGVLSECGEINHGRQCPEN